LFVTVTFREARPSATRREKESEREREGERGPKRKRENRGRTEKRIYYGEREKRRETVYKRRGNLPRAALLVYLNNAWEGDGDERVHELGKWMNYKGREIRYGESGVLALVPLL